MLTNISVESFEKIEWTKINFGFLINLILNTEIELQFEKEWFIEILKNDQEGRYLKNLLYSFNNENTNVTKIEKTIEWLGQMIKSYPVRVSADFIARKHENDDKLIKYYNRALFILLDNSKLKRGYLWFSDLDKIIDTFTPKERENFLRNKNLDDILSPIEIKTTQNKYGSSIK